jgi:hypothetical protein
MLLSGPFRKHRLLQNRIADAVTDCERRPGAGASDRRSRLLHPPRSIALRGKVNDLDLASIRNVDKHLGPAFVDLEALRMRIETEIGGFGPDR